MLNVICYWFNDWCVNFGPEYVWRLYRNIKKYTTVPYNFCCFSDKPQKLAVPCIKFEPYLKWNLNKFLAFEYLSGRVISFDLDIMIFDNIDDILAAEYDFACTHKLKGGNLAGGSIISTTAEYGQKLAAHIKENKSQIEKYTKGSERLYLRKYIKNPTFWQNYHSGIYSYKHHCKESVPKDCRIMVFHGNPRPHETEYWYARQ